MEDSERKQQIFVDLEKYKNKLVTVKMLSGQHITGKLLSFDKVPNLVLEKSGDWEYGKKIICMGHSVLSIALGKPTNL
ncbi:U6 snRNA-associated Sm [Tubulinosema ratisbonensis]|uniref:U6 snRNA-associated Sm n=1 Tax=Tubulinosema ratisbonensis TaxID=291195 RepID=A0A437AMY8_9MICR|nr:U6 snRNA-associated Sm [Tubulinosema ratisbonensis]